MQARGDCALPFPLSSCRGLDAPVDPEEREDEKRKARQHHQRHPPVERKHHQKHPDDRQAVGPEGEGRFGEDVLKRGGVADDPAEQLTRSRPQVERERELLQMGEELLAQPEDQFVPDS